MVEVLSEEDMRGWLCGDGCVVMAEGSSDKDTRDWLCNLTGLGGNHLSNAHIRSCHTKSTNKEMFSYFFSTTKFLSRIATDSDM